MWLLVACTGLPPAEETGGAGTRGDAVPELLPGGEAWTGELYDPGVVHTVELTMSADAVDSLRAVPDGWVRADLRLDGHDVPGIGARIKGSASFQPVDQKPAWKLEVDHFTPGLRALGAERLTLNNEVWDPTMMAETMAYRTFRETGAAAPRTGYAQVSLNGRPLGVYSLLESMDDHWVEARWPAGGGLWESTVGCDFDAACTCFEEQEPGDPAGLAAGCAAVRSRDDDAIRGAFDWPRVVAFLAAEQAVNHPDSYSWNLNNFWVHHDPDAGLSLSPWGADSTFIYAYPVDQPNPGCDPLYLDVDVTPRKGALARHCLTDAGCRAELAAQLEVVADWMEADDLAGRMAATATMLDDYAGDETWVNWNLDDRAARVACFQTWTAARPAELRALAAGL